MFNEKRIGILDVRIHRHRIVRQIVGNDQAVPLIVYRMLQQRHSIPMVIPLKAWLRAVFALITLPMSNTPRCFVTRTSPVSASTRTSLNCAPKSG